MNLQIYNTKNEIGLRILILLSEIDGSIDLQRLIYYDYALLHSKDIVKNKTSIHPNNPYRYNELLIKREIMNEALSFLIRRNLISVNYDENGIIYKKSLITIPFLGYFESEYFFTLKEEAKWVIEYFNEYDDKKIRLFFDENIGNWGSEFIKK